MCVFGIPRAREDDALRGCLAALEIQRELGRLNQRLQPEWGVELSARIGLNTGEVVAGDSRREQALVTGDAVNTAARLEQAAAAGQVLIGGLTRELAGSAIRSDGSPRRRARQARARRGARADRRRLRAISPAGPSRWSGAGVSSTTCSRWSRPDSPARCGCSSANPASGSPGWRPEVAERAAPPS